MNFEQPPLSPERSSESIRGVLLRRIGEMNELQAQAASLDIDEIDTRPEIVDAQAALIADLFVAAEKEPDTMLELAGEIVDLETRRDLTAKAVVAIGARGDASAFESALEKHKEGLRAEGWEEEMVERDAKGLREDVLKRRIGVLLEGGETLEAVKMYAAGGISRDHLLEGRIADAVRGFVLGGADLSQKIERYAQLPDRFPRMDESIIAFALYREAHAELPPGMPWEEGKTALKRRFAEAPDILVPAAIERHVGGWDRDDNDGIFKAVRDAGGKESVLSRFLEYHFTPEGFQELKPDLFAAYLKSRPDAILDRIGKFKEEFDALPEEERQALLEGWITEEPVRVVYRMKDSLSLSESQLDRLFDRVLDADPARLFDPDFTKEMAMTVHQAADLAVRKGKAGALVFLPGARSMPAETYSMLANSAIAADPDKCAASYRAVAEGAEIDPAALQEGLEKLFSARNFSDLAVLERESGARLDVSRLPERALRGVRLTDVKLLLDFYPELEGRLAMAKVLGKLEKIQGRAARAEHDAWKQELEPLLGKAYESGLLSPERQEDAELFLEFVKEFGAVDTPKLFETYVGLKRAKTVEEIPEGVRRMLEETLGKKRVEKMKTPAFLLNEIRKFDRGMVSALLEDKIPAGMASELGLELFDQKKGASNWSQDDDPKDLIAKWERFKKASPERAAVPEGYVETRMSVPLMERGGKDPALAAILERPEVRESFDAYGERLRYSHAHSSANENLIQEFIAARPDATGFIEAARIAPDQGKYGVEELTGMMEALKSDGSAEAAKLLARLSAEHARLVAPAGRARAFWDLVKDEPLAPHDVARMRDLLVDYVSEHYLHPSQETHRTGHEPFSPELRAALEKAWGLADKDANPIIKAFDDMEALNKNGKKSGKAKEIALVPAQGLLRVYGGDLADACYTSRHNELAEGKYPDLHAMIFVTGRGTASERFAGSVLFIETETPPEDGGKKVLMVRANNPRENLIQDVDADALIRQTLDEAVATAKRRGLDMVVVPLDEASTSSSNRSAVSKYYEERFSDAEPTALQRTAETNFNGYPNWDPDSGHGVVAVWSREDEAEEPG